MVLTLRERSAYLRTKLSSGSHKAVGTLKTYVGGESLLTVADFLR